MGDEGRSPGMNESHRTAYWRANLRYIVSILAIWFAVSYGAGILFADRLDAFRLGGFPLGYWFATQGSILTFVVLNFVYVGLMNALDRRFGVYEE
jgi:putative solute:sodium symporter small subunit